MVVKVNFARLEIATMNRLRRVKLVKRFKSYDELINFLLDYWGAKK